MSPKMEAFSKALTAMDLVDVHGDRPNPAAYLKAARLARECVLETFSHLPMTCFDGPLRSLCATAENVFFESRGRLPNLDKSGRAHRAQEIATHLMARLTSRSAA